MVVRSRSAAVAFAALVSLVLACAPGGARPVAAQTPQVDVVQAWPAASGVAGWDGGAEYSNPGTGGVGGVGDGYLRMARSAFASRLGVKNSIAYLGDWIAAGATTVRFYLNDVGADQNLEIHFCVGNSNNFWQYTQGFAPPENSWAEFSVDLTDSSKFSHIISFDGLGFAAALRNADRVLIRHDLTPYVQSPDAIQGEVGIDNFLVSTHPPVGVPDGPPVAGVPVELAPPFPNPARGPVTFAFDAYEPGPVRLAVYDARGRLVRAVELADVTPGRRLWMWDGRDEAGQLAPAGAYRVRATGRAGGTSRALVRL